MEPVDNIKNKIIYDENNIENYYSENEEEYEYNFEEDDEYYQNTLNMVYKDIMKYCEHTSLPLCEYLEIDSVDNFINSYI